MVFLTAPFLGGLSGLLVGLVLGMAGGGGSILAVPLMLFLVGVRDPHVAIGTSAFAVSINALGGLAAHAAKGNVNWRCGALYACAGSVGAMAGSTVGKLIDGSRMLALFALVMTGVGLSMLRARGVAEEDRVVCQRENMPQVLGFGLGTGLFSGFFGIGGGFLIVPGLVASTGMAMLEAVGTSLLAVTAFGLTTSLNYAISGQVDWSLAVCFIAGGALGSAAGLAIAGRLADGARLGRVLGALILTAAAYTLWRSLSHFAGA